jgi:hypothetical protein
MQTMKFEIDSLKKNGAWELVHLPEEKKNMWHVNGYFLLNTIQMKIWISIKLD